jgi:hypothetical protein
MIRGQGFTDFKAATGGIIGGEYWIENQDSLPSDRLRDRRASWEGVARLHVLTAHPVRPLSTSDAPQKGAARFPAARHTRRAAAIRGRTEEFTAPQAA